MPMEFANILYVSEQVPSGTPKNHQFHENSPIFTNFTNFHGIPLKWVEFHENDWKSMISTILRSTAVPAVPAAPAVPGAVALQRCSAVAL